MFRNVFTLLLAIILLPSLVTALPKGVTKEKLTVFDTERTYFLFIPDNLDVEKPAPAILLLHGSGRDGWSLVKKWMKLAEQEGIVLIGPNSEDPKVWSPDSDDQDFLETVVEHASKKVSIDFRRIYLFGHSGGACWALYRAVDGSEYYAAAAVHAGMLDSLYFDYIKNAARKIPISIQVGTRDKYFPLKGVRATRDAFEKNGFTVELTEIRNHDHWYYDRAPKINARAWEFLKKYRLEKLTEDLN